jgi:hypothetical protein
MRSIVLPEKLTLASFSYFPNMIFYGPEDDQARGVRGIDVRGGTLGFRALIDAVKRERSAGRRWRGFLYTNDVSHHQIAPHFVRSPFDFSFT